MTQAEVMITVIVRDEDQVDGVGLQSSAPLEFRGHESRIGQGRINEKVITVSLHQGAGAERWTVSHGVPLTPVTIARQVSNGDDIPALNHKVV